MFVSLALADELFLMTHDLQSGKARVPVPGLGIGLAAALLAELMFAGSFVISPDGLSLGEYGPPPERLSEALYDETRNRLSQQTLTVRDWLAAHRRQVTDLVADRLIRTGYLRRVVKRRFGRTVARHYPVKPADAFIQAQRLPSYLRHGVEVTEPDVVVVVLVGLMTPGHAAMDLDDAGREYLRQLLPALQPPVRDLLSITESSIMAAMRSPHF
jgi:hypothetical protein